jgi:hypothetical protein
LCCATPTLLYGGRLPKGVVLEQPSRAIRLGTFEPDEYRLALLGAEKLFHLVSADRALNGRCSLFGPFHFGGSHSCPPRIQSPPQRECRRNCPVELRRYTGIVRCTTPLSLRFPVDVIGANFSIRITPARRGHNRGIHRVQYSKYPRGDCPEGTGKARFIRPARYVREGIRAQEWNRGLTIERPLS